MIKTIFEELGGWVDEQEILYYIEQTNIPITQEFVELIISCYQTTQNIKTAVNLAAGIIIQNQEN